MARMARHGPVVLAHALVAVRLWARESTLQARWLRQTKDAAALAPAAAVTRKFFGVTANVIAVRRELCRPARRTDALLLGLSKYAGMRPN